jgi:hypothetical protein
MSNHQKPDDSNQAIDILFASFDLESSPIFVLT